MTGAPARFPAPWLLVALSTLVLVATFVLQWLTREVAIEAFGPRPVGPALMFVFAIVGGVIASAQPRNTIGWLFLGFSVTGLLLGNLAAEYAVYSVVRRPLPFESLAAWLQNWTWVPTVGAFGFIALLFPDGRLHSRRARVAAWAGVAGIALMAFGIGMTPGQLESMPGGYDNPYSLSEQIVGPALGIGSVLVVGFLVSAAVSLVMRFRRSTGESRQQLKWMVFAGWFFVVSMILGVVANIVAPNARSLLTDVVPLLVFGSVAALAAATAAAILKYGLYEIDIVINKTVVFATMTVAISALYAGIVITAGAIVGAGRPGPAIVATAAVALAFQPVRSWAHRLANRVVYGKRATPYEALSEFAGSIAAVGSGDVLARLARLMTEATAADRAAVWLVVRGNVESAAVYPQGAGVEPPVLDAGQALPAAPGSHVFAVRQDGELLGVLSVETHANEPLQPADETLLSDLASQTALVMSNARLIAELRASRQRLVTAQDAERRRIERDLHDGAQQQLVALAVNLRVARQVMSNDPDHGARLVEQVQADAIEALENLRALARGIYPPLLAEKGLTEALRAQAAKGTVPTEVSGDGLARYAQEVESAIYFCVLEALQNVAKYAEASQAHVELRAGDGSVQFTVTDDGRGFDVERTPAGSGLTNMVDRIEALGGRVQVVSAPGEGTRVEGRVPT